MMKLFLVTLLLVCNAICTVQAQTEQSIAHYKLAVEKSKQGDVQGAVEELDRAINNSTTGFAPAYYLRAQLMRRQGKFEIAISDAGKAIAITPNNPANYALRASLHAVKSDFQHAVNDYTRALELMENGTEEVKARKPTILQSRGMARMQTGDVDGAMKDLDAAINLDPKCAVCYIGRATVRRAKDDKTGALADYDQAIELNPNPMYYSSRASLRRELGDLEAASQDLKQAQTLPSQDAVGIIGVKTINKDLQGNTISEYANSSPRIVTNPRAVEASALISQGLLEDQRGNTQEAINLYTRAIEITDDHNARLNRGGMYRKLGKIEEAMADYTRAIELEPKLPFAYMSRASLLMQLGKTEEAERDYAEAVKIDPKMKPGVERLSKENQ